MSLEGFYRNKKLYDKSTEIKLKDILGTDEDIIKKAVLLTIAENLDLSEYDIIFRRKESDRE